MTGRLQQLREVAKKVQSESRNYKGEGWRVDVHDSAPDGVLSRTWFRKDGCRCKNFIAEFTNLADDADRAHIANCGPDTILVLLNLVEVQHEAVRLRGMHTCHEKFQTSGTCEVCVTLAAYEEFNEVESDQ